MSVETIDGTPITEEIQASASLMFFETPNKNIIVINDSLMNIQDIILTKEDFARVKKLHEVGGNVVELKYTEGIVSQEFNDEANSFNFFPEFELIEDITDAKYIGTIIFKDRDISSAYVCVPVINNDDRLTGLMNTSSLIATIVDNEDDANLYRIAVRIKSEDPEAQKLTVSGVEVLDHVDVLKAISIDVGPLSEEIERSEDD